MSDASLVFFFACEYHDFLICFDTRTVNYIEEYRAVPLQQMEDAGKPVSKFTFICFLEGILSKHFFFVQKKGFKFELLFHCLP